MARDGTPEGVPLRNDFRRALAEYERSRRTMAVDPVAASAVATAPLHGSCRKGDQDFVPAAPATKASTPALTPALTNVPTWSGWTRCRSTFSFVFAPPRPGVFVLAEEVGAIESGRR